MLKKTWHKVVLVLGAVIGFLLYWLSLKNKKLAAYKAKIELVKTQRQADLLEIEIKEIMTDRKLLKKEREDLEQALKLLEEKRNSLKGKSNKKRTVKDVESYWNK